MVSLRFWLSSWLRFHCGFGSRLDCGFTAVLALVLAVVSLRFWLSSWLWFHCGFGSHFGCGFAVDLPLVWTVPFFFFFFLFFSSSLPFASPSWAWVGWQLDRLRLMSVDHTLSLLSISVFAPYVCVCCVPDTHPRYKLFWFLSGESSLLTISKITSCKVVWQLCFYYV